MLSNDLLRRDVRMLGDLLGDIIQQLAGGSALALVEDIRRLARERRAGDVAAETALEKKISAMSEDDARVVARAFSVFFDLANLAEDRHRIRVLRDREQEKYPQPISESIPNAVAMLRQAGLNAEQVAAALGKLSIDLVFTAHPSEAKRRAVRGKLRRMRLALQELDRTDLLPRERERLQQSLKTELFVIWQTEFLRPMRPTVADEVERGMSIMPRIWEVVPQITATLRQALRLHYPEAKLDVPTFLRFGSWMGGDRDGNPNVTATVTKQTLIWLREYAINQHVAWCRRLTDFLTVSLKESTADSALTTAVDAAIARWPKLEDALHRVAPSEVYRRWIGVIRWRLERSRTTSFEAPLADGAYRDGRELAADVQLIATSLSSRNQLLVDSEVQVWLDLVGVFGLHLTRLDIRQDARRYQEIMAEVLQQTGLEANYDQLDEEARLALLARTMPYTKPLNVEALTPLTRDTLDLYRVLHTAIVRCGPDAIGGHVISLTRSASDVLCVLWLWRWAQATGGTAPADAELRIVPLFEKIDDLTRASQTLAQILDQPAYTEHLERIGRRQIVMIGYSDSTKDGGYLAACWGLYRAQAGLTKTAAARKIPLTFFHGRGGSLGRGGGPAARGILSLPPESHDGTLRLTEQGEVLAERYDDVQVAYRHLEQVTWATLIASALPPAEVKPAWLEQTEKLAARSLAAYRELVDLPGFIRFFADATPIDEIENLPIGSRPSRRRGERTLDDLRAIPWVFSWTQNRCMIPAWYGLGAALTEVKYGDRSSWQTICEMYRQWPFWQATIDNAALALAKADMYIAQRYSELAEDDVRQRFWTLIASERDRTRQAILDIVGGEELLASVPWFRGSIEVRNPYIDPLNLIQIEMLRRRRAGPANDEAPEQMRLRDLLRLTVQGIAAGMRTTG